MAGKQSKTARQSMRATESGAGKGGNSSLIEGMSRLIPLNAGRHCYLLHPTSGRTLHLATDSEKFVTAIAECVAAGQGARIQAELQDLHERFPTHGWDATLARLHSAQVFAAAVPAE